MHSKLKASLLGMLLLTLPLYAQAQNQLGTTSFQNSGAPEAQQAFLNGLLLLHSFEYEDARDAFIQAQEADPDFAMAYWGEAMTHNHPIWQQKYRDKANDALAKLGESPAARLEHAPTKREKEYLKAVDLLFAEGDKLDTDKAYAAKMEEIYQTYPEDLDAAAFYALALLGTSHGERDYRIYMKAAAVVEDVFRKNPNHPGAAHYLIHSYDDPVHAPLGLRAAESYAQIAPSAAHALHMPSHIFVALGMWQESASTNAAAYQATVDRAKRKGIPVGNHHALSWLIYDQLQMGQYDAAGSTLEQMMADMQALENPYTRFHYAIMHAYYTLETNQWDPALEMLTPNEDDNLSTKVISHFIAGLQAQQGDDTSSAHKHIKKLDALANQEKATAWSKIASVLKLELEALEQQAAGNHEEAILLATQAAEAESSMEFVFGPPRVVKPAYELLGEILLDQQRFDEAIDAFEKTLEQRPGRSRTLKGMGLAALHGNRSDVARKAIAQLRDNWKKADEAVSNALVE